MNESELQPWLAILGDGSGRCPALWRVAETGQAALALFSTAEKAERYAGAAVEANAAAEARGGSAEQPTRLQLVAILIECYRQNVELAVLDPDAYTARSIFKLADLLRAARTQLE
jgi:hypothetical protein